MQAMRLQDKVAVVTGGGSGIGRAISTRFAEEGAKVAVVDLDGETAAATSWEIDRTHRSAGMAVRCDVTSEAEVAQAFAAVTARWGRVDILVNCAGVGTTHDVVDTSLLEWEAVFAANVRGTFLTCRAAIPLMRAERRGVIINMSSVAALVGLPQRAAYCAAKGAVAALTRAMAVDHVADGIRVNALAPGTIATPWVERLVAAADDPAATRRALIERQPMNRLGSPEEVAAAAVYLASDEAAFVTGTILTIDGGITAR
jgi:NAD(P)-dependent dehydrogenase (short-subunit alcohol dehydrogenase family)